MINFPLIGSSHYGVTWKSSLWVCTTWEGGWVQRSPVRIQFTFFSPWWSTEASGRFWQKSLKWKHRYWGVWWHIYCSKFMSASMSISGWILALFLPWNSSMRVRCCSITSRRLMMLLMSLFSSHFIQMGIKKKEGSIKTKKKIYGWRGEVLVLQSCICIGTSDHYPGLVSDLEILRGQKERNLSKLLKCRGEGAVEDNSLHCDSYVNSWGI